MRKFIILTVILVINFCLNFSPNILGQEESTRAEIFNYEIGDIFHTHSWHLISGWIQWEEYATFNILNKYYSTTGDILFYEQEIFKETHEVFLDTTYYENYIDTIYYPDLDSLIWDGNTDTVYSDPLLYNGRVINSVFYISPEYDYEEKYSCIVGCGGAYTYQREGFDGNAEGFDLIYYLKGDEEWGTPYFVSIPEKNSSQIQMKIYPNPSSEYLIINQDTDISEDFQVSIFTSSGECVKNLFLKSGENRINVSDLSIGFYTIRVLTDSNIFVGNFIKN